MNVFSIVEKEMPEPLHEGDFRFAPCMCVCVRLCVCVCARVSALVLVWLN